MSSHHHISNPRYRSATTTLTATLLILLLGAGTVTAQTRTWIGTADTLWDNPSNWSPLGPPTSTDDAIIQPLSATVLYQPATYSSHPACNNLTIQSAATMTLGSGWTLSVGGNLSINSGASLATFGTADINGSVTLGDATSSWDLGTGTHTVAGSWTSSGGSAASTGAGTINFDGNGSWSSGMATIANVVIGAGTRSQSNQTASVAGNLAITGGTLSQVTTSSLTQNSRIYVGGDFQSTGGTIAHSAVGSNDLLLIDVAGDVNIAGLAAVTLTSKSQIHCGGNWTSDATFAPTAGLVRIDGPASAVQAASLPNLTVASTAVATTLSATALAGTLTIESGGQLTSLGSADIAGGVSLADGSCSWDLGSLTHFVAGSWSSSGGSATSAGSGTVTFDGNGSWSSGMATIANVVIGAGTRSQSNQTASVAGNLAITGGTLSQVTTSSLTQNSRIYVGGDFQSTGGTIAHSAVGSNDLLLIDVAGDVNIAGLAAVTLTSKSQIHCGGNWTSDATFAPTAGLVRIDGPASAVQAASLPNLTVASTAVATTLSATALAGTLTIESGGQLTSLGSADIAGGVSLADGSSSWDLGSLTHFVAGSWSSSGGSATSAGSGTVTFDGNGSWSSGMATIANVVIGAGTRSQSNQTASVAGNLAITGGTLSQVTTSSLTQNSRIYVGGDFQSTGGTIAHSAVGSNDLLLIDVAGDVNIAGLTAVTLTSKSQIHCGGNWTSDATFAPTAGLVRIDGPASAVQAASLPNLTVASTAVATTLSATALAGTLTIESGGQLTSLGSADIAGGVSLADGSCSWDLGSLTHFVAGSWSSSGGSATSAGSGTVTFDGNGSWSSGMATIANVVIGAGTRSQSNQTASVAGNLAITGGTLSQVTTSSLTQNSRIYVGGDFQSTGGTIAHSAVGSNDLLLIDVAGDVNIAGLAAVTLTSKSQIHCGGNWTSDATFAPTAGTVRIDGPASAAVAPTLPNLTIASTAVATTLSTTALAGSLTIESGGQLTSLGSADIEGGVTLADDWDLGSFTHFVAGTWTSTGGSATSPGAGTINFDGTGNLHTGAHSIPKAVVSAGTRTIGNQTASIIGNFDLLGGTLSVLTTGSLVNTSSLLVGGTFTATGGSMTQSSYGSDTVLIDVEGDVAISGLAQATLVAQSRFYCAGNWTSDATFAPTVGIVRIDGPASAVIATNLSNLTIASSAVATTLSATALAGTLTIESGAQLTSLGSADIDGSVSLGDATCSWDLGNFTHFVAGNWGSSGCSATTAGGGAIDFDGTGYLHTAAGSIPKAVVSAGTRTIGNQTASIIGNFDLLGGTLSVLTTGSLVNTSSLLVGGTFTATGGSMTQSSYGSDTVLIDVEGDVAISGLAQATLVAQSRFYCAGNWTSDATFAPTVGIVRIDGSASAIVAPTLPNLTIASSAAATTLSATTLAGSLTIESGAQLTSLGSADIDGSVSLGDATCSWDLGNFTHLVAGNWGSSGCSATTAGGGAIDFDGTGYLHTAAGSIPKAVVSAGTRTIGNQTASIIGNFDLLGGTLSVLTTGSPVNTSSLLVGGTFTATGGSMSQSSYGSDTVLIDVEGDVAISGLAQATLVAQSRFYCAGNWTSDATFAPTVGIVRIDGSASAIVAPTLPNLTIASSAAATTLSATTLAGSLTIESGAQLTSLGSADIDGSVSLGDATCSWDLGNFTHLVAGNWGSSGCSATSAGGGAINFNGTGYLHTGAGSIAKVAVSAGTRTIGNQTASITGDFDLLGGTLSVLTTGSPVNTSSLLVGGTFTATGGSMSQSSYGSDTVLIDVEGDVAISGLAGATLVVQSRFHCAGNWTSDATFAPTAGTVHLDGGGTTSLAAATSGGTISFDDLVIKNGTRQSGSDLSLAAASVTIEVTGSLDVAARTVTVPSGSLNVSGGLSVGAGGVLALGGAASVTINPTGTLSVIGTSSNPATVGGSGGGGYPLTVNGTIAASNYVFSQMGAAGLVVSNGATLAAPPNDLRAGTFTSPSSAAGAVLLGIVRPHPTELRYVTFLNPLGHTGIYNVRTTTASAPITFVNFDGAFAGPFYEDDPLGEPGGQIIWAAPQATDLLYFTATEGVEKVTLDWETGGEVDVEAFVLERALSAGGPFSLVTEVLATGPTTYQHEDLGLEVGTTYHYRLSERLDVGIVNLLATDSATPLPLATTLAFGTAPTTPIAADQTWPGFTVRIEDDLGGLVIDAENPVTITQTSGPPVSGLPVTVNAVAGIATATGLTCTTSGTAMFDVTSPDLTSIIGTTVVIEAAAATQLTFAPPPASPQIAGQDWAPFSVRIEDQFGNLVEDTTDDVTLSVVVGTGTLDDYLPQTPSGGTVTFTGIDYDLAEVITVAADAGSLTTATAVVDVQPAVPASLAFAPPPASPQVAGVDWAPFTVRVEDTLGNLVADATDHVTLTVISGTSSLLGTWEVDAENGLAVFDAVRYEIAEDIVVEATANLLASATTAPITIGPAAAHHLALESPLAGVQVEDVVITPAVAVRLEDEFDNLVTTATDSVVFVPTALVGTLTGTLTRSPTNGVATFDDLVCDTPQTLDFELTSGTLIGLSGNQMVIMPFHSDLKTFCDDMIFTPPAPAAGQPTLLQARVVNAGQVTTQFDVHFYQGSPEFGGALLGTVPGSLSIGAEGLFGMNWAPPTAGITSIYAVVENLTPPEETPGDNRASKVLSVGAAPEHLCVKAGERVAWPGAELSVPVVLRNIGAGSLTISTALVDDPTWATLTTALGGLTLAPGEIFTAMLAVTVPATATGAPLGSPPVEHTVSLTIDTGTATFGDHVLLKLYDQPASTVTVTVTDGGATPETPIAGALVSAQDLPGNFVTDGQGEVVLALPPGPRGLFAYKSGFLARAVQIEIPEGSSAATIELQPGQVLEIEQVTSELLTSTEAIARGVDPTDLANNHVFDFVVAMRIGEPVIVPTVLVPIAPPEGSTITFSSRPTAPGGYNGGGSGTFSVQGSFTFLDPANPESRTETWIIIPGDVMVLKEFFEVTVLVVNNADIGDPTTAPFPEDIQIENLLASLAPPPSIFPSGLALPDLDGSPQLLDQIPAQDPPGPIPGTLNAGEQAQATWIVRGDVPGVYVLACAITGELYAFGSMVTPLDVSATSDPFEVTVPRLRCEFITPTYVTQDAPFNFEVLVTNESVRTAGLVRVTIGESRLLHCELADPQSAATLMMTSDGLIARSDLGDLLPGHSGLAHFELISHVTGPVLEVLTQNGCTGDSIHGLEAVSDPPSIVAQPVGDDICEGQSVVLTVAASGTVPITYQWRKDGVDILGATTETLDLDTLEPPEAGDYDVVATNLGGSTASLPATISVKLLPSITTQPLAQTVPDNGTAAFTVVAGGATPLTYQWFKDGTTALSGADSATLTITPVTSADQGDYHVVVTNECDFVASIPASLTVVSGPVINSFDPYPAIVTDGDPAQLTAIFAGGSGVIEPGGISVTSAVPVTVDPTDGSITSYTLTVTNTFGATATATTQVQSVPAPDITSFEPSPAIVTDGDTAELTAIFTGGIGVIEPGTISVTSGTPVTVDPTDDDTTLYTLTVTNLAGAFDDATTQVQSVPAPDITSFEPSPAIVTDGDTAELTAIFTGGIGVIEPGTISVTSGTPVTVDPTDDDTTLYTLTVTNLAGAFDDATTQVQSVPAPVIISFDPTDTHVPNGGSTDLIAIFTGGLGEVDPGSLPILDGVPLLVTPPADSSTTYELGVTNAAGLEVTATTTVHTGAPPVITNPPAGQTVPLGGMAIFSVTATGAEPLSYQWRQDAVDIPSETETVLTIDPVSYADQGTYTVFVTNDFGYTESAPVSLLVASSCAVCDGTEVVVDQDVILDFNTDPPTYIGDPDLLPYFGYDTSGPTADTWKAIFDLGPKTLRITGGAKITMLNVLPSKDERIPGIEIRSTCELIIDPGSGILLDSAQHKTGDILVEVNGSVTIHGIIRNEVTIPGGHPGRITVASNCGDILVGSAGIVEIQGCNPGATAVNLVTCAPEADIVIAGLVRVEDSGGSAPEINVVAFGGSISIDGTTTLLPNATGRVLTTGVLAFSVKSPHSGTINLQAFGDISVVGNAALSTDPTVCNFGAVAAKTDPNTGVGGEIFVRSLGGQILAVDRAFDNANRPNATAVVELLAAGDILLSVGPTNDAGASDNSKMVINTNVVGSGHAGSNILRSFSGGIFVEAGVHIVAAPLRSGADGENLLTWCTTMVLDPLAVLSPAPVVTGPVINPTAPDPIFNHPSELGVGF